MENERWEGETWLNRKEQSWGRNREEKEEGEKRRQNMGCLETEGTRDIKKILWERTKFAGIVEKGKAGRKCKGEQQKAHRKGKRTRRFPTNEAVWRKKKEQNGKIRHGGLRKISRH